MINGFCLESRFSDYSTVSAPYIELNPATFKIITGDNKEISKAKHSSGSLYQFFPYAILSGIDTICPDDTAYLSVRLVQGTPPWSFTYTINGKASQTISGINDKEYMLEAVKEGIYKLTSVKDSYRRGFVSGEGSVVHYPLSAAILSGLETVCEGQTATLRVDLNGTPPFMIKYRNNHSVTGTVSDILSSPGFFGVKSAGNYTLTAVADKYCTGTFSGSATVSLLPVPDVSIEGLGTAYSLGSDPVPVFGIPDGGFFTGEGLIVSNDTMFFLPSWAGTEDSPHKIGYSYQNPENGCIGRDSVMVDVLEVDADIIFPDNRSLFCFNEKPFNIRGFNANDVTGSFMISGGAGLTDNGDNTAIIDPSKLDGGEYEIIYSYYDKTWFEYTEKIDIEYVSPIWFIGFDRNSFCDNEDPVPLNGNVEEGIFHGNGVTGNTSMGFSFLPSSLDNNRDTVYYTYTTEHGCKRQVYEAVTIYSAPTIRFSYADSCITHDPQDSIRFINNTISKDSIISWDWDFDDIGSGQSNFSGLKHPKHLYTTAGTKYVKLIASTVRGCDATKESRINLGYKPKADFTWDTECYRPGQPILFSNQSKTDNGILEKFEWQVELADTLEIYESDSLSYLFQEPGDYFISLIVASNYGCSDRVTIPFSLRPVIRITENPYFEDFESGMNGWGSSLASEGEQNSWVFGKSENDFPLKDSVLNYCWFTRISQGVKEDSWVISPCFDFSDCTGPMIKFNGWRSFNQWRDGVVIQYSDNNGELWHNIGDLNDGIKWYNGYAIEGKPGGQSIGWSNIEDKGWTEMRHSLDSLKS
ncbi:MAG: PKD domain-containing protein, partial [Bacteroidales bacterium]|nr:PKD domain-containing protein [Bacteroidales bacterium]